MITHSTLLTILTLLLCCSSHAATEPSPHIHLRSGLPNLQHSIEIKKHAHIAFLGGSITENTSGHTAMVPAWLKQTYPDTKLRITNAGWGSTCSTTGAFRLESQIFANDPVDLLIIEFAVNDDQDAAHAKRECIRGMEGIVRQAKTNHPNCDLILVHYINPNILTKIQNGETPTSIAAHEAVAAHYDLISINVAAQVAADITTKKYTWEDYGGTHPAKFGYQLASDLITTAIQHSLTKPQKSTPLKAPLDPHSYHNGKFIHPKNAKTDNHWKLGPVSKELLPLGSIRETYKQFQVLRTDHPGAELTLSFKGNTIGAFILAGPDAGIIETSIDGSDFKTQDLYHRHSAGLNYPRSTILATDLTPGDHTLTLRLTNQKNPKSKGTTLSLLFFEES